MKTFAVLGFAACLLTLALPASAYDNVRDLGQSDQSSDLTPCVGWGFVSQGLGAFPALGWSTWCTDDICGLIDKCTQVWLGGVLAFGSVWVALLCGVCAGGDPNHCGRLCVDWHAGSWLRVAGVGRMFVNHFVWMWVWVWNWNRWCHIPFMRCPWSCHRIAGLRTTAQPTVSCSRTRSSFRMACPPLLITCMRVA